ncbi:hypothetical protein COX09_01530 [Candidatus Beckwithbacteria bacterium CG23_combo_of_CG06-09_8_20_14_all_47_9]|uniref:Transcriptional repressor PaaX-like C-terminal domain-containing protein n=1 Tax=Candidatus Beckwithbacteria bacterium CG23_combo_of_CG06-09_8_20_14_all_47_9 TaxID=1974498 RepID=A0A2H0B461_9BACT|nr:MAG: hypothetical protein COX09_01530 [Candidatus Beckwithbacteria bacterium CG23_combo_of_CG06-09_8_20_14_all_47_9]
MKLLKKKLLFSLLIDQPGQEFEYHDYHYLYYRTSEFNPGSARDAVNELVTEAAIDKLTRNLPAGKAGRRAFFRLTSAGREILLKNLHPEARQGQWDRRWRIVIVNKIGVALRPFQRELDRLGYRRLSRGVYLSAANVSVQTREILMKNHWLNQAAVIESRGLVGSDDQILARNLWQLEKLGEEYDQFIILAQRLLVSGRRNLVLLQQAKFGFKAVFDAYFKLVCLDPGLPKPLLPPNWRGEDAKSLFFRLVDLAKTAKI